MEHKKYPSITRMKDKYFNAINEVDKITITEKIDGANASFMYDSKNDTMCAFSRNLQLGEENTLRGFLEWVESLDKAEYSKYPDLRFFGEWLVSHTVQYPNDKYKEFYLFDVVEDAKDRYLCYDEVSRLADELKLNTVPLFYKGNFVSWEHVSSFVGKTALGGEFGEGVVVKNETVRYRMPQTIKLICENFNEVKGVKHLKQVDPSELTKRSELLARAHVVVNDTRVLKILFKMVDEGLLPIQDEWLPQHMSIVSKELPKRLIADCESEEGSYVNTVSEFGKIARVESMKMAKQYFI